MSGPISPPLTVTTVGGTPSGRPITTIKVSNGDLTISGSTATIDTSGGGGGGSGTVTSIATTAPITGGTITTTGTIGISQADGSTDGFLSSTDWNTFDAKQGAITLTTTGTSGTASLVGTTLNIPNYTNSSTIGGTIANTQVAYGSAADTIQGSANLTFDGSNLSVGGYVKSGGIYDTTGATDLVLKTNGGTNSGTLTLKNGVGGNAIFQPDGTGVFQFNGVSGGNDGAIKLMCSEGTHSQTISAAPHASASTYSLVLPTGLPADADNKYLVSDTSGNMSFTSASGGGGGGIGGSIADNQIAVGATTADEIEGGSTLTFDGTILTFGSGAATAKLTSNGSQDLVLTTNTNASFVEPYIQLNDSDTGNLYINSGNNGATTVNIGRSTSQWVKINNNYFLPQSDGSAGQVLQTNGSGTLSFATSSGGIGGAITDNQVAYGDLTANDIEGNAKFTYNVSTQTLDIAAGAGNGTLQSGSSDLILRNSAAASHSKITLGYDTANSNIVLDTDGSGLVEIHKEGALAYSLPNVVTGVNDYVLTAQTDGSTAWAAAGGGNDFNVELCGTELDATGASYPVFDVMALAPYGVARFNTLSVDTKQYFFPFISPFSGDVGTMLYNITSAAGSATNLYMAIYTDNNGVPDEVLGYATLDATVDGSQTTTSFSSTITLVRGTQYYMAYNKSTSESISMRAIDNSYLPRIAPSSGFPSTTNGYSTGIVSNSNVSSTPAQTSPNDLEPAVYFAGLGGRPHIGLKV